MTDFDWEAEHLASLEEMLRTRLGADYTNDIFEVMIEQEAALRGRQQAIQDKATSGEIRGRDVAHAINDLLTEWAVEVSEAFGPNGADLCERILDAKPGDKIMLVDPNICEQIDYTRPVKGNDPRV